MSKPAPAKGLNNEELRHYARHLTLPGIGEEGQVRLKNASVLLVGLGGLGSPLALYLTAAGVGRIGIVEFDKVDITNLHRQVLYGSSDVGERKLDAGIARLRDLNPHVEIVAHGERFQAKNGRTLVSQYDLVADGADNFSTRYLVNDACVLEGKPLVSASILGFEGQLSVFHYKDGPCYRCLYPEAPPAGTVPSCAENGVLGVLPGVMGTLQATEVVKILAGIGEPLAGRLLHYDALSMKFTELRIGRDLACPACGEHSTIRSLEENPDSCVPVNECGPGELERLLASGCVLLDVREDEERRAQRIDPSLHIPLADLLEGRKLPPKENEILCYCRAGFRSLQAARFLAERGFKVRSLKGGILAWNSIKK